MSSSNPEGISSSGALAAARRYTRAGTHSAYEVRTYLCRRGCSSLVIRQAMRELRSRGLIDDGACARLWAEQWARAGYAWAAIRQRLNAKALSDTAIELAASRVGSSEADDEARARLLAARARYRSARQLARALAARGFEPDMIERIAHPSTNESTCEYWYAEC